ncbi:hypothetical protein ACF0H5_001827 [Mactra antiquata]
MMMGSYFILCVFLAIFCGVGATPMKDSDNATTSELPKTEQCGCSHDIQQLYSDFKEMREEQKQLKALVDFQTRTLSDQSLNIDTRALFPDVIGFTAVLDNAVDDIPLGSNILYDRIHYNAGSHYDPNTGVFTCPRSGMYLFSVFVEVHSENDIAEGNVKIMINGNSFVYAISEPSKLGHDSTGGNVLIQHLARGDRVWVETNDVNNQDLFHAFNSFSGVLIQSTE